MQAHKIICLILMGRYLEASSACLICRYHRLQKDLVDFFLAFDTIFMVNLDAD